MPEEAAIRTGCEWIAAALTQLAEATEGGWQGEGIKEVATALGSIGEAILRHARAVERLAEALAEKGASQ